MTKRQARIAFYAGAGADPTARHLRDAGIIKHRSAVELDAKIDMMRADHARMKPLYDAIVTVREGFQRDVAAIGPRPRWYRPRARKVWDARRRAVSIDWREYAWETVFPLIGWKPDLVRAYAQLEQQLT